MIQPATDTPLLTVCVPTYSRPALVARTIASVVGAGAGHEDLVEVLVSDNSPDVSEDTCRTALRGWAGRSLYIPNRPNIGAIANFNQCVARASGRYILFVHDDDVLLPNAIADIMAAVQRTDLDAPVLLFGVRTVDGHGRVMRRREFRAEHVLSREVALRRVLSDIEFVRIPAIVVRRDAYEAVGPFDPRFGNATDLEMWVRLFARHPVRCVPGTISVYWVHQDTATTSMSFDEVAIETLMKIFDAARATGVLTEREVAVCQREFFHQFLLGAAYLRLRGDSALHARKVMRLFRLPTVRRLGWSVRWLPVRLIFELIVRSPAGVVKPLVGWVERHDLVRRVRAGRWS